MVAERFQIYSDKVTANTFVSQKLKLLVSTQAPKQNSLTGLYQYPPGRQKLLIPPEQCEDSLT